jgi:hypothetical protein
MANCWTDVRESLDLIEGQGWPISTLQESGESENLMSVCSDNQFLEEVRLTALKWRKVSNDDPAIVRATRAITFLSIMLARKGGFCDGTLPEFRILMGTKPGTHFGDVRLRLTRKHNRGYTYDLDMSEIDYESPGQFSKLVADMQQTATAMREIECPTN